MPEVLLVDELERDRHAAIAAGDVLAFLRQALVPQKRGLVEGKLEVDRIGRDDRREQRGVAARSAGHEIAGRNPPVADTAVDRRTQLGELKVELGLPYRGLGTADGRPRVAERLRALLERLVRYGLVTNELLPARIVGFRIGQIRLRLRQSGTRLIKRVLERAFVDGKKQIALLDELPVLEMQLVEIARDARAHLDGIDGGETPDIFVIVEDRALDRLRYDHRRWWWRTTLLLPLSTARDESRNRERQHKPRDVTHQEK